MKPNKFALIVKFLLIFLPLCEICLASRAAPICSKILTQIKKHPFNRRIPIVDFDSQTATARELDDPSKVGTLVTVSFNVNQYGQLIQRPDLITQKISAKSEVDDEAIHLIEDMTKISGTVDSSFRETAAWIVYTKTGAYRSEIATGSNSAISTNSSLKVLYQLLTRIKSTEGTFAIEDIEFYHTHLHPGEAFNIGDVESHQTFDYDIDGYAKKIGFTYSSSSLASYAVPTLGRTFFIYKSEYQNAE